jgi:hypothetical protein
VSILAFTLEAATRTLVNVLKDVLVLLLLCPYT